jgi:hypothetical protein
VLPKVGRVEQAAALLFSLPTFFSLNRLEKFGSVAAAFCGHPTKNSSPRDPECIGDITIAVEADLIWFIVVFAARTSVSHSALPNK